MSGDNSFDEEHGQALEETGFWGRQGAGGLVLARSSGRLLVARRSDEVLEPLTWGTWGGAIDPGENPEVAVVRELAEETGYAGEVERVVPLYRFRKGDFVFHNFLLVVQDEFEPELNWENVGCRWCEPGKWPRKRHFGFKALLADAPSVAAIIDAVETRLDGPLAGVGDMRR